MDRRTLLAGVGTGALASLSGCLSAIGMAEHTASPAGVPQSTREETGYEQVGVDELKIEQSVGVGPLSETVVATNYQTNYEKAVELAPLGRQRAAVFTVLTTPKISLLGRDFNPVEEMDAAELVDLIADNYDGIGDVSPDGNNEITILEQSTTRSRFTAAAQFDGTDVDVDLHVTEAVDAGDDLAVTVGVYPQELRQREEANVVSLMEHVLEDLEAGNGNDEASDDGAESGDDEDAEADGDDDGGLLKL